MLTIDLPADVKQFIQDAVTRGDFRTESEVVTAALRIFCERERKLADLRRELEPALARLDRGEGIDLDEESLPAFFDGIIARGKERLGIKGDEA